jgi:cysteinyl-tRNA synthetase
MTTEHHPLTLYNSLTRTKEQFVPQDASRVTMYNCGPTVYSYAHIGNARAAVVADVLFRVLRQIYGEDAVKYARNITDVDDKIIAAATEAGVPMSEITEKYARIYNEDLAALNCLKPTYQPKATEHIDDMIAMISKLLDDGVAYASDGHVFFDVAKYPDYGQLSGNTLDALRGGDRVGEGEVARKKNAADFVLWKPELNGVGWDAPFGRGRPGWHIECSAMAKATLKTDVIDIHCGGVDLKFPHHENERAQSCCANDASEFAKFWVHNEFLNMGKDKMSKSLGNVTLVRDLLKDWDGEVIRLALLKAHYRSELSWSEDLLRESKAQLDGWYRTISNSAEANTVETYNDDRLAKFKARTTAQMNDDLDLIRVMHFVASSMSNINGCLERLSESPITGDFVTLKSARKSVLQDMNLLGLLQRDPEEWFRGNASDSDASEFDAIAKRRETARAAKDWAAADAARDEATARGIVLEDGPDGTTWRKA